jgi:hypothetical protein
VKAVIDHLGYDLDPSILIGGWATYRRVGGELSADIDLIINSPHLRQTLRTYLHDYSENTIHSGGLKIRGDVDGVHIEAYIPHESSLGDVLRLDVQRLSRYIDDEIHDGWYLLTLDAHIATKLAALLDRPDSEKGRKDAREIVRLMREDEAPADGADIVRILLDTTAGPPQDIPRHMRTAFGLLADNAGLGKRDKRWLDAVRREWIDEADRQVRRLGAPPALPTI